MIKLISLIFVLAYTANATADSIKRNPDEAAGAFVARVAPQGSKVAHKAIETAVWNLSAPAIVAFYESPSNEQGAGGNDIEAALFLPAKEGAYERIAVDRFETENGSPNIESVFFASIGAAREKNLCVIVSWPVRHADVNGRLYSTYIYAPPKKGNIKKLAYLKSLSERMSGGCDCSGMSEPSSKAKFKTAAEVKAALQLTSQ